MNELQQIRDVLTDCKQEFWDDWHSHISEGDFENHWLIMDIDKALATIDRLIAEQGWQPIETAPRDGTDIYATRVDAVVFRPSIIYFEKFENRGWLCSQTHYPVKSQPTHWMPLPQPPTKGE